MKTATGRQRHHWYWNGGTTVTAFLSPGTLYDCNGRNEYSECKITLSFLSFFPLTSTALKFMSYRDHGIREEMLVLNIFYCLVGKQQVLVYWATEKLMIMTSETSSLWLVSPSPIRRWRARTVEREKQI